jgi:Peptidase S24-like
MTNKTAGDVLSSAIKKAFDEVQDAQTISDMNKGRTSWLARKLGVTPTAAANYIAGRAIPRAPILSKLNAIFFKKEGHFNGLVYSKSLTKFKNGKDLLVNKHMPVLDFKLLSTVGDITNHLKKEGGKMTFEVYNQNCFAIKLTTDSMESKSGVSLPKGSIVIVDTAAKEKSGNIVIYKHNFEKNAGVGVLFIDKKEKVKYIKFLNKKLTPIEIDDSVEIVGVCKRQVYEIPLVA